MLNLFDMNKVKKYGLNVYCHTGINYIVQIQFL